MNTPAQNIAAIGRRGKVLTLLETCLSCLDIKVDFARRGKVIREMENGTSREWVMTECNRMSKMGWRMKNSCSSIGTKKIFPTIEPAG